MKGKLLLFIIPLILGSCSKWIAPPYTSVDRMLDVQKGMNSIQVDEALGIKPYNMLHRNENTAVFEYHYRLKDRDVNNIANYKKFIHEERSQTGGKEWFNKPSKFYVLYENDLFSTMLTENGLEHSDYLLVKNNNLILVSRSELVEFKLWEDATYLHKIDNTARLKASVDGKHHVMYVANIPWAPFGLKYAFMGKFGGYASFASDFWAIDEYFYITGGFALNLTSQVNAYLGGGIGPYVHSEDWGGDVHYEYHTDSPIIETGAILQFGRLSVDVGGGVSIFDFSRSFGRIGFGVNF